MPSGSYTTKIVFLSHFVAGKVYYCCNKNLCHIIIYFPIPWTASHCSEHTYSDHSWRCLPQLGTKRRGEGILRMEDAGTSEEDDIGSQDSNTPIDYGHLARNCSIKIITPAVKDSVITLYMFENCPMLINLHNASLVLPDREWIRWSPLNKYMCDRHGCQLSRPSRY